MEDHNPSSIASGIDSYSQTQIGDHLLSLQVVRRLMYSLCLNQPGLKGCSDANKENEAGLTRLANMVGDRLLCLSRP